MSYITDVLQNNKFFSTELIKVLILAALKHAGFVHPLFTSTASYLTLEITHVV